MHIGIGLSIARRRLLGGSAFVGILDQLSTPAAGAWSVARRLSAEYEGPLIQVRRSSDNATADIGYDSDNVLDETALLAHVGAGNGFVVTAHDQSGGGNDLTMATAGRQPRIVSSGVVDKTANGEPCMEYIAANNVGVAKIGATTITTTKFTILAVAAMDSASNTYGRLVSLNKTGQADWGGANSINAAGRRDFAPESWYGEQAGGVLSGVAVTYGLLCRATVLLNGSTHSIYTNDTGPGTPVAEASTYEINDIWFGSSNTGAGTDAFDGKLCEFILIPDTVDSGELATAEANMDSFYGL